MAAPFDVVLSKRHGFGGQIIRFNSDHGEVRTTNSHGKSPVQDGVRHVAIAVAGTQRDAPTTGGSSS